MKKLTLITAIALTLASYSPSAATSAEKDSVDKLGYASSFIDFLIDYKARQTLLEQQHAEFEAAQLRATTISERITKLEKHVDKTWYVFSGSTPRGWDCSGLVMWFYSDLQVELKHSVTAQMNSGKIVKKPLPGDIISFSYPGSSMGFHNGIYIGEDLFIHSPRPGTRTRVSSVEKYMDGYPRITYTRIDF